MFTVCSILAVITAVWAAPSRAHGQTVEQGRAIFAAITEQYPNVHLTIWGLATANPAVALFIPEMEWSELSKEEQVSLAKYVESQIAIIRANPRKYVDATFRADPLYGTYRTKIARLCRDCWIIGVGRLTMDKKGALFEKVVVQGDSVWERSDPRTDRGVKASEFWRGLKERVTTSSQQKQEKGWQTGSESHKQEQVPHLASLLARAEEQIADRRFTLPVGDNAVETYREALRLAPGAEEPLQGMRRIVEQYRQWAEAASQRGEWAKARAYYERALTITPQDEALQAALHHSQERSEAEEYRKREDARLRLERTSSTLSETALLESAENGASPARELILTPDVSAQVQDEKGWTALMYAAWEGHTAIVQTLLEKGVEVNASNAAGGTALMMAAIHGHTAIIQALLNRGAAVNTKDAHGWTPLMYAVWNNHTTATHVLLNHGADVNAQDKEGWTALMYAAWRGHAAIVRALLGKHARVAVRSNKGESAVVLASQADIVELLQQAEVRE